MAKKDPWMLNSEEAKKTKEETKFRSTGEICPKRNLSLGKACKACEEVSAVYQSTVDGDPKRKVAGRKSAKASYFANIVLPSNPNKSVIAEMGKKLGDTILDMLEKGKWLDIAHPKEGYGRELTITKKMEGDYPSYSITAELDKADYDIPDETLENLPNLDQENLIEILTENTETVLKISSLKLDETMTIRMCPPWKEAMDRGEKRILTPVFRHWGGVTKDEIANGGLTFGEFTESKDADDDDKAPWEDKPEVTNHSDELDIPPETQTKSEREPCFGKVNVYEEDDEECQSCRDYKPCGRAVAKAK